MDRVTEKIIEQVTGRSTYDFMMDQIVDNLAKEIADQYDKMALGRLMDEKLY